MQPIPSDQTTVALPHRSPAAPLRTGWSALQSAAAAPAPAAALIGSCAATALGQPCRLVAAAALAWLGAAAHRFVTAAQPLAPAALRGGDEPAGKHSSIMRSSVSCSSKPARLMCNSRGACALYWSWHTGKHLCSVNAVLCCPLLCWPSTHLGPLQEVGHSVIYSSGVHQRDVEHKIGGALKRKPRVGAPAKRVARGGWMRC